MSGIAVVPQNLVQVRYTYMYLQHNILYTTKTGHVFFIIKDVKPAAPNTQTTVHESRVVLLFQFFSSPSWSAVRLHFAYI